MYMWIFDIYLTCLLFSLDALDPNAYEAFQASNNLSDVVQRCMQKKEAKASVLPGMSKKLSIRASLMTPVKPMLVCFFVTKWLEPATCSCTKSCSGTTCTIFTISLDWFWTFSQAEACKSFSQALKKCPSGMYAEIKYDGERVQVLC